MAMKECHPKGLKGKPPRDFGSFPEAFWFGGDQARILFQSDFIARSKTDIRAAFTEVDSYHPNKNLALS